MARKLLQSGHINGAWGRIAIVAGGWTRAHIREVRMRTIVGALVMIGTLGAAAPSFSLERGVAVIS